VPQIAIGFSRLSVCQIGSNLTQETQGQACQIDQSQIGSCSFPEARLVGIPDWNQIGLARLARDCFGSASTKPTSILPYKACLTYWLKEAPLGNCPICRSSLEKSAPSGPSAAALPDRDQRRHPPFVSDKLLETRAIVAMLNRSAVSEVFLGIFNF